MQHTNCASNRKRHQFEQLFRWSQSLWYRTYGTLRAFNVSDIAKVKIRDKLGLLSSSVWKTKITLFLVINYFSRINKYGSRSFHTKTQHSFSLFCRNLSVTDFSKISPAPLLMQGTQIPTRQHENIKTLRCCAFRIINTGINFRNVYPIQSQFRYYYLIMLHILL
jgi:hypothetical protein